MWGHSTVRLKQEHFRFIGWSNKDEYENWSGGRHTEPDSSDRSLFRRIQSIITAGSGLLWGHILSNGAIQKGSTTWKQRAPIACLRFGRFFTTSTAAEPHTQATTLNSRFLHYFSPSFCFWIKFFTNKKMQWN